MGSKFYDETGVDSDEATRLELMARYADDVSLCGLEKAVGEPDAVVVDIGAGDSTSLGSCILARNPSARYVPIDQRQDAVRKHQDAGFDGLVGYAHKLPVPDSHADALHARFVFGWLPTRSARIAVFEEMLRVAKPSATLTVIDYDWSVAQGPGPVNQLLDLIIVILGTVGFDTNHGGKIVEEMAESLRTYGYSADRAMVDRRRTRISEPLGDVLGTVEATIRPILNNLDKLGLTDQSDELRASMAVVRDYAVEHSDARMDLPDIVRVTAQLPGEERTDVGSELSVIGPTDMGLFRLPEPMHLQARRVHATVYRSHRIITDEGVTDQGVLIDEIDPKTYVDASTYLGAVNRKGMLTSNIRIINFDGDATALPTVMRLLETLGADHPMLKDQPFLRPEAKTGEASALAKSERSDDPLALPKLILALICQSRIDGYDYLVFGVVNTVARKFLEDYGPVAFNRIGGDDHVAHMTCRGIGPEGKKLIPFYLDVRTFVQECLTHMRTRALADPDAGDGSKAVELFERVCEFLGDPTELPATVPGQGGGNLLVGKMRGLFGRAGLDTKR